MIINARWITKTEFESLDSVIEFSYDVEPIAGLGLTFRAMWNLTEEAYNRESPGGYEYIQEALATPPTKTIDPYQIPLKTAKKNFRAALDNATRLTLIDLTDKDVFYDGESSDYFLELWPEFFEFERWRDLPDPKPARPPTPKMDFYAELLRVEVGEPGFSLGNARGRLRAQLSNRRFRIMAEKTNASGDLVEFRLRQPPYISMQKEAKQYLFSQINNAETSPGVPLPDNEKADQIQALAETMIKPNGEPRRFNFDDDPLNPVIVL